MASPERIESSSNFLGNPSEAQGANVVDSKFSF
jgi:hypothetical protein